MASWDPFLAPDPGAAGAGARNEAIELVGPHLRLTGTIDLRSFDRLSDLINRRAGYVRIDQARLLRRNGEPTRLLLPQILINEDEISFIAQTAQEQASGTGARGRGGPTPDRPLDVRQPRRLVIFTPGHTLSGTVHLYGDTDLAGFVDGADPRFVPMVGVKARSLADRRVISHFEFALVNRTQMIAVSEVEVDDEEPIV